MHTFLQSLVVLRREGRGLLVCSSPGDPIILPMILVPTTLWFSPSPPATPLFVHVPRIIPARPCFYLLFTLQGFRPEISSYPSPLGAFLSCSFLLCFPLDNVFAFMTVPFHPKVNILVPPHLFSDPSSYLSCRSQLRLDCTHHLLCNIRTPRSCHSVVSMLKGWSHCS